MFMMKSWHLRYFSFLQLAVVTSGLALHARQDVQAEALTECSKGLPFSCQANTDCIPTNAQNTSVVCCPTGSDCNIINQIPCDISQQNVTQYPNNQVHTSELDAELPTCGTQCCPLGYNCAGNLCVMAPKSGSTSPSTSLVPPVATAAPSTGAAPTATESTSPISGAVQANANRSNTKAVAIGVPVALIAAALIGLAILFLIKRRRRQREGSAYVNHKPLRHMSSHSTEFMGQTPRPLSLPQQYVAPLSSPPTHSRSASEPQTTAPVKSNASVVSQPMWDSKLNGGPLHRTDFLLRRGSVETGYEDKIKPSWSTRSKYRPKSLRLLTSNNRSATDPVKQPKTPAGKSPGKNRLTPLFSTPLRFGLPLSPSPGKNKLPVPASRAPRSDENLARLVKLEGKTVASGEAKRVSNHAAPSPQKAKKMRLRDRSESARRPLVENVEGASRAGSVDRAQDRKDRGQSLERHDSDASATTIESGVSSASEGRGRGRHAPNASTETINVLLPPPSVFQTPPPTRTSPPKGSGTELVEVKTANGAKEMVEVKRDTTFEDMMQKAGWRKSEWLRNEFSKMGGQQPSK